MDQGLPQWKEQTSIGKWEELQQSPRPVRSSPRERYCTADAPPPPFINDLSKYVHHSNVRRCGGESAEAVVLIHNKMAVSGKSSGGTYSRI